MAKIIGLCVSLFPCIPRGKMYYRGMEHSKLQALQKNKFKWGKLMTFSDQDKIAMKWWLNRIMANTPHRFRLPPVSVTMDSDASLEGWGISLDSGEHTGFRFDTQDSQYPINTKELLAVWYGLRSFQERLSGHHILLQSDSTTALADLRRMGTMCNPFQNGLTCRIYRLLDSMNAQLSLTFLPGCDNILADEKSRIFTSETSEWSLDRETFQFLLQKAPDMNFDLFASHLNAQLPQFCSWMPTPGCSYVNAFSSFNWNSRICYAYPPCSVILKSLEVVRSTPVSKIYFVVPWRPTAVWFPLLQQLLTAPPISQEKL